MTRPSIIALLGRNRGDEPKIFIRTLLYCTSDQGQYIENMYIRLHHLNTTRSFNIWGYGENEVVRGSGLYISKGGMSIYHHFLLPKNEKWEFEEGDFIIEIFAETVGRKTKKIFEQKLTLTTEQSNELRNGKGIYFDWIPNSGQYLSHIENKRQ